MKQEQRDLCAGRVPEGTSTEFRAGYWRGGPRRRDSDADAEAGISGAICSDNAVMSPLIGAQEAHVISRSR